MYVMKDYDLALERILKEGVRKENRTGVDTIALFGIQSRYRIDKHFPFQQWRFLNTLELLHVGLNYLRGQQSAIEVH